MMSPRAQGTRWSRRAARAEEGRRTAMTTKNVGHWINGARVAGGANGRGGDIYNPSTGEVAGRVAFAGADEVDRAVQAALAAFPAWAATPPLRRARIMFRFKELVE